jgi:RES domain
VGDVTREVVAQQPPTVPLEEFPTRHLTPGDPLRRAHTVAYSPWWFGSDGGGRFDLPQPRGTCYLASLAVAALRERLGIVLGSRPVVPASLLDDVVISTLHLPDDRDVADVESEQATRFGVTRELETMVPYAVPQAWARAFDGAGIGGVAYGPRFTTGDAVSYAIFGPAGAADWPVDPEPVAAAAVPGAPVAVVPPRRWDLTVVRPPRTRTR